MCVCVSLGLMGVINLQKHPISKKFMCVCVCVLSSQGVCMNCVGAMLWLWCVGGKILFFSFGNWSGWDSFPPLIKICYFINIYYFFLKN